jgi:hypothetical protein
MLTVKDANGRVLGAIERWKGADAPRERDRVRAGPVLVSTHVAMISVTATARRRLFRNGQDHMLRACKECSTVARALRRTEPSGLGRLVQSLSQGVATTSRSGMRVEQAFRPCGHRFTQSFTAFSPVKLSHLATATST